MKQVDLQKLKNLRKGSGLTQEDVAKTLEYKSALGYHYLETGRCQIKAEQLMELAKLFGVPIESLFVDSSAIGITTGTEGP